jgi:hypothetical protein
MKCNFAKTFSLSGEREGTSVLYVNPPRIFPLGGRGLVLYLFLVSLYPSISVAGGKLTNISFL